ncbi:MAG: DUF488 family protein [Magnetovibrio sp.]|nr:DUF488 family protein [Magnetovibrio sp.]
MLTGSFFTTADQPGRIGIARFAPKRFRALPRYSALAPGPWFKSVPRAEYERRFADQLAALDPAAVWDELHALAGGEEPILLCWERPGQFCHRRLVAGWFERGLGETVAEFQPPAAAGQMDLFAAP